MFEVFGYHERRILLLGGGVVDYVVLLFATVLLRQEVQGGVGVQQGVVLFEVGLEVVEFWHVGQNSLKQVLLGQNQMVIEGDEDAVGVQFQEFILSQKVSVSVDAHQDWDRGVQ